MDALVASLEILAVPEHPEHRQAAATIEAWQRAEPDHVCCALSKVMLEGHGASENARLLGAIALKNAIGRVRLASVPQLRDEALRAVSSSCTAARRGGSMLIEALLFNVADAPWPELVPSLHAMLSSEADADAALRVLADMVAGDDDPRRRGKLSSHMTNEHVEKLLEALVALTGSPHASHRRRALNVATKLGWVDRERAATHDAALATLSVLARDTDAGARYEVLSALRALLKAKTLDTSRLVGVAEFCMGALRDVDSQTALAAAEWFSAFSRVCEKQRSPDCTAAMVIVLQRLTGSLLQAMRYSDEEIREFDADSDVMRVGVPDREEDVEPLYARSKIDDESDSEDEEQEEEEEELEKEMEPSSRWTLRKCAASTLDTLARADGPAVASAAFVHISAALASGGPWEREAALLALGALADGADVSRLAPSLAGYVLGTMRNNPQFPQLREISAWVLSRCAETWFADDEDDDDDTRLFELVDALVQAATRDDHKRVVEASFTALAVVLDVGGERLRPLAPQLALALATSVERTPTRARFALYSAISSLAWSVSDTGGPQGTLKLLEALDARWTEISPGVTPAWKLLPLLQCSKALASKAAILDDERYWQQMARRSLRLIETAVEMQSMDDDDDAGGVNEALLVVPYSLDLLSTLGGPLRGQNFDEIMAQAWPALAACLALIAQSRHAPIASATLALVGDVASRENAEHFASALLSLSPLLLHCLEASWPKSDEHRRKTSCALATVAHNACWAIGQIAVRVPCSEHLASTLEHVLMTLVSLLGEPTQPPALRDHTVFTIGRCLSREDVGVVGRGAVESNALKRWLDALGAACATSTDLNELVSSYASALGYATRHLAEVSQHPPTVASILGALAAWRRRHPPAPPPQLAVAYRRLLEELKRHGPLSAQLEPIDLEYLSRLYG